MKKIYIRLISLFIILSLIVIIYVINKPRDYKLEYSFNEYKVKEEYNKNNEFYSFSLTKNEYIFYFALNSEYSKSRKLIKNINEEINEEDNIICLSLNTKVGSTETICNKDNDYYLKSSLKSDLEKIDTFQDIDIYNKDYKYYEWNGYGFTDILSKKEYKVLEKESYNNSLSYKYNNYIIFADYDSKNEFNKFYLFNTSKNKFETIKFKDKISFDSYFEGIYKNNLYLFDRNKNVQYSIDFKSKKITKTSDNNGGVYYDGELKTKSLNNFKYNNIIFKEDNLRNYYIEDNNLYYVFNNFDIRVKVDEDIDSVIYFDNNTIIYLKDGYLYKNNLKGEVEYLLSSLEWEFRYTSQIYVF